MSEAAAKVTKSGEMPQVAAYRKKLESMGEETLARARAVRSRIAKAHASLTGAPQADEEEVPISFTSETAVKEA